MPEMSPNTQLISGPSNGFFKYMVHFKVFPDSAKIYIFIREIKSKRLGDHLEPIKFS